MKLYWNSSRCSWTPNLPLQKGGTRRHYRLVLGRTGPFLSTTYTPPILDMMHSFEVQCTCATLAEARQSLSGSPLGGGYTPTHPPPPWWEPAQGPPLPPHPAICRKDPQVWTSCTPFMSNASIQSWRRPCQPFWFAPGRRLYPCHRPPLKNRIPGRNIF